MSGAIVDASRTQVAHKNNLDIKETTQKTTVKDDCRTKLMYYLNCVASVSDYLKDHPQWYKYIEYETCSSWTIEDEEDIYYICHDIINLEYANEHGFIEAPDEMLGNMSNRFFDATNTDEFIISQLQLYISKDKSYIASKYIGAKSELKMKIMLHTKNWIYDNYHNPLKELLDMFERQKREKREAEEKRLREIREEEERKERERKEEEERKIIEEEMRKERERRIKYNRRVLEDNKYSCCLIKEREKSDHPYVAGFLVILYFIHSVALMYLYLQVDKDFFDYNESPWLKWVQLASFIMGCINFLFALISFIVVCSLRCLKNWKSYLRILMMFTIPISAICIPLSYFMYSYAILCIVQVMISLSMFCFNCVTFRETNTKQDYICLCCGVKPVSVDNIAYYL